VTPSTAGAPPAGSAAASPRPRRSITWPVLASMALVSTIIFGAFLVFYYDWESKERYRKLQGDLDVLSMLLSESLTLPLWNVDRSEVALIIESAMRDRRVVYAAVKDLAGNEIVGLGRDGNWSPVERASFLGEKSPLARVTVISYSGHEIGVMELAMTRRFTDRELLDFLIALVSAGAGLSLCQVMLLYLAIKRIVLNPLARVDGYARRITQGSADAELAGSFSGEIESLRASIETMVRALMASEKKYRAIFENAVEGIFQSTSEGRVVNANPALARILGYASPEEYMAAAKDVRASVYERGEDRDKLLALLQASDFHSNFETRLRRKDGSLVWVAMHARAVRDGSGRLTGMEGILEDISKRKQAEEELVKAMEFVSGIIDSMPSVMIALREDGTVVRWNRLAARRYSIEPALAGGRLLSDLVPGLSMALDLAALALKTGQMQLARRVAEELEGETRIVDLLAYPVTAAGSTEAVLRIDDVTSQARMEEIMVQTEKMMSLGGLTAGMAHEVNNPLAAIMLSAENLRRRLDPDRQANKADALGCGLAPDTLRCYMARRRLFEMIDNIYNSSKSASDIVRNMLEFSRKSGGGFTLARLESILDKAVDMARQDYDLKKNYDFRRIEIIRDYDPDMPSVPCKPQEIEQVLVNLLRNAAQAMFSHEDEAHPPAITLRTRLDGDHARIVVADNGPGMPEDVRKRVFEPFFTTKPVGVGTGLGLSVSFFIITRNHGGQFFVESAPGKGATFTVRLPLAQQENGAGDAPAPA